MTKLEKLTQKIDKIDKQIDVLHEQINYKLHFAALVEQKLIKKEKEYKAALEMLEIYINEESAKND